MTQPCTPRIDGTRLYGRGAYDMKASLAAIMLAGREAVRLDPRGNVIVTAVADEEFASIGVRDVVRHMVADAEIVAEPTGLELCVAHKAFVWLEVETHGVASLGAGGWMDSAFLGAAGHPDGDLWTGRRVGRSCERDAHRDALLGVIVEFCA